MYLKGSVSGWGMEMDGLNFPIHFGSLYFYGRGIEMDKAEKWMEHRHKITLINLTLCCLITKLINE